MRRPRRWRSGGRETYLRCSFLFVSVLDISLCCVKMISCAHYGPFHECEASVITHTFLPPSDLTRHGTSFRTGELCRVLPLRMIRVWKSKSASRHKRLRWEGLEKSSRWRPSHLPNRTCTDFLCSCVLAVTFVILQLLIEYETTKHTRKQHKGDDGTYARRPPIQDDVVEHSNTRPRFHRPSPPPPPPSTAAILPPAAEKKYDDDTLSIPPTQCAPHPDRDYGAGGFSRECTF